MAGTQTLFSADSHFSVSPAQVKAKMPPKYRDAYDAAARAEGAQLHE